MDETDFEGTTILEMIAVIDKVDEFFEAIDSDDFAATERMMKAAGIDLKTIEIALKKMADADGQH